MIEFGIWKTVFFSATDYGKLAFPNFTIA